MEKTCTYCDRRYGGCIIADEDFIKQVEEEKDCVGFIPGKCFFCAMYALDDTTLCDDITYPCGCDNFKAANNYGEYLRAVKEDECSTLTEVLVYNNQIDRIHYRDRRDKENRHKKKQIRKAKNAGGYHPGIYFDEKANRVKIWERGSASRWLKKLAHRSVRRQKTDNEQLYQRGQHKKLFDYWWELF